MVREAITLASFVVAAIAVSVGYVWIAVGAVVVCFLAAFRPA
ncbi:MAG: hypothetical protein AAB428_01835 [Patescibacteria group bacterium]